MRVFVGLGDICGYYSQLAQGLVAHGVPCTFVNAYPSRQYSRQQRPGPLGSLVEWLGLRRFQSRRGSPARYAWTAVQALSLAMLFLSTLPRHRAYIFSGGTSFFAPYDLWLLRLFGKRVIMVFHGSDGRPPYLNAVTFDSEGPFDAAACVAESRRVKQRVAVIERNVDVVVTHTMSAHFHETRIIPFLAIGIPYDPGMFPASLPRSSRVGSGCVIVHAPTRPGPKGTAQIERAIESLRRRGHAIEFVKLVGRTNAEVLEALASCDFVVDDLFSDSPMGSFGAEAAMFGKPSIVGMYGLSELAACTEPDMLPPAVVCLPEGIEDAIERLVVDPAYRLEIGARAHRFVIGQWSAAAVAGRFLALINDQVPHSWWFEPSSITYLHGMGLSRQRLSEVVGAIITQHGRPALQLADKPLLEAAFTRLTVGSDSQPRLS